MSVVALIVALAVLFHSIYTLVGERRRSKQRRRWYAEVRRNRSDNLT